VNQFVGQTGEAAILGHSCTICVTVSEWYVEKGIGSGMRHRVIFSTGSTDSSVNMVCFNVVHYHFRRTPVQLTIVDR